MTPLDAARRRRRLAKIIKNGTVLLTAAPSAVRSRDTHYAYRQDSYFFYLTACQESDTALIMNIAGGRIREETFFCPPKDAEAELWDGKRLTPATAKRQLGFDNVLPITALHDTLRLAAQRGKYLYYLPGQNAAADKTVGELTRSRRLRNRAGCAGPAHIIDIADSLDDMRLIKDTQEIKDIKRACALSGKGMKAAMRAARRARYEYEVEAAIIHAYRNGNGEHAFLPIVAGGANACTLHYTANNARLNKNALLLADSGAELNGYVGDITRTFPANGEWTEAALTVYQIVLAAQECAIRAARPGALWSKVEAAATRTLAAGLCSIGLCSDTIADIIDKQTYKRFYPHSIGHPIGLDVHDVGNMTLPNGKSRALQAGMVMTIEPGLYIPTTQNIARRWRGIGVRIEDDILLTKTGNEVLTADVPKTPEAISRWMLG